MVVVVERPLLARDVDERAARRTLRDQIARLEAEVARMGARTAPADSHAGPRLLGLAELERTRDALAARVAAARAEAAARAACHAQARDRLERMRAAPADFKWVRISNADLGEPGCRHHHSRPRLGLLGMLAGWWHVKISSGCPSAPDGAAFA